MPKLALETPSDPVPSTTSGRLGTHACGACGARLFTARFATTGILVHVEIQPRADGDLYVVPELPGLADGHLPHVARTTQRRTALRAHLPHVARTTQRRTALRAHNCPKVKQPASSFTGSAPPRKVRP